MLDPDGHGYVNGLDAKDFELLDNNKQQKISAEFTQQSMSVVLVVQANADVEPVLQAVRDEIEELREKLLLLFRGVS